MNFVLVIEDGLADFARIKISLEGRASDGSAEPFKIQWAKTLGEGLGILRKNLPDAILLDMGLPDAREFTGLETIKAAYPSIPVVVLTRRAEDTLVGVEALKRGAQDYCNKNHLSDGYPLERVILYAIERQKIEEELIRTREAAEKASRAKSEFLSNMSHDIRTPLNSIVGVTDLLSRAPLADEQRHLVKILKRGADNLILLINSILDLSKIESGQVQPVARPFDILETLENVFDLMASRAHAQGLELVAQIEPNLPRRFVGDDGLLNQILINLIGNAIKFTKTGEVAVLVSAREVSRLHATLVFRVKDTGMGIPSDKISSIFDSFVQLENVDTPVKRQGSGLGLAICKRIADLLNGHIHVESEEGKGSCFELSLPLELASGDETVFSTEAPSLSGRTALVVADNAAHAQIIADQLKRWGATVVLAKDGAEAVELVRVRAATERKFDFALIDLRLRGSMGGLDLLKGIGEHVVQPVMMLPTNHRQGDLERLRAAGVYRYYFKPTRPDLLAEALSPVVPENASASDTAAKTSLQAEHRPRRLLVVDDSEDNRLLVQAYCKDTEFELEVAEDGVEAVEKFKSGNFDLVLMDLQMPAMNGYQALEAIRRWEATEPPRRAVPVLALTAYALKEEARKCISAGFAAHVTKPITKNVLIQTIRQYAS